MSDMICDHANKCKQNPEATTKAESCSSRHPHRYNHEECNGFNCPHAKNEWVKCVPLYIPNPELKGGK